MVYLQTNISQKQFQRIFNIDVDSTELVWHRDRKNRWVEVIQGGDWQFQMEDELPITLVEGMKLFVPKEVYHRVIKGSQQLIITITEDAND